jgi:hypothetical protein
LQPFTANFPRADIHELLSPDLLHQVIKGCFKDHLVMWVGDYLLQQHGEAGAAAIMADIDRRSVYRIFPTKTMVILIQCKRIAAAPLFPGLRCFPQGHGFKQWTGDDSKALMKVGLIKTKIVLAPLTSESKVYIPAIQGHVPRQMICA